LSFAEEKGRSTETRIDKNFLITIIWKGEFMYLIIFLLIFISGCVQARDYVGVREGAFGLNVKKGFGDGANRKDYYLFEEGTYLIAGDSKNEVISRIGLPSKVERTLDSREGWVYEDKKMVLYFKEGHLNEWNSLEDEAAREQ